MWILISQKRGQSLVAFFESSEIEADELSRPPDSLAEVKRRKKAIKREPRKAMVFILSTLYL